MAKQTANNVRLGIFVVTGIFLLVFALYMIGQNRSFWSSSFVVKSHFKNVNGLMAGNNVRFAGIQCGTVKEIVIINDATIEVTMLIDAATSKYIRQNAYTEIGTEGLMGNKVVNIIPNNTQAPPLEDGGTLQPSSSKDLGEMLGTLSSTNDQAATLAAKLNEVADKLNNSAALWSMLSDTSISTNLQQSMQNIRTASVNMQRATESINEMMTDIKHGKGVASVVLQDQQAGTDLSQTLHNLAAASAKVDLLVQDLNQLVATLANDVNNKDAVAGMLLKDTALARKLSNSLDNVEKGTAAFSEDMEALKHNFLFRSYFRKQEKNRNK